MAPVGIVTALEFEARAIVESPYCVVRRCGIGGTGAEAAVRELSELNCGVVVSWGCAGALTPEIRAGDVVLAESILTRGGNRLPTDPAWRARFGESMTNATHPLLPKVVPVAEAAVPIGSPADKRRLGRVSGAGAADMESGRIGSACATCGVPFLAIRCILDELDDRLPAGIESSLGPDGAPRPLVLLATALRRPRDWPEWWRLGDRYRRASKTLAIASTGLARCHIDGS